MAVHVLDPDGGHPEQHALLRGRSEGLLELRPVIDPGVEGEADVERRGFRDGFVHAEAEVEPRLGGGHGGRLRGEGEQRCGGGLCPAPPASSRREPLPFTRVPVFNLDFVASGHRRARARARPKPRPPKRSGKAATTAQRPRRAQRCDTRRG